MSKIFNASCGNQPQSPKLKRNPRFIGPGCRLPTCAGNLRMRFGFVILMLLSTQLYAQTLDEKTWPLARGDEGSQGFSPSTLTATPSLLWEQKFEGTAFEVAPVIVDGRLYIGDLDGEFYCLDATTGTQIWKNESESGYLASAAVQSDFVVVGDYDGLVRGLKVTDGNEVWKFQTDSQIDGGANFHDGAALITSEDGKLYSLELQTGKLRWAYETGDQLRCGPTIAGGRTFLGGCDGKLHIVDLAAGTSVGDGVPLEGPTGSTPAAADPLVIAPTHSGQIFGIDWKAGERRWTFTDPQLSQEIQTSPAIHNGLVFVVTKNRKCLALEVATGKLKWEHTLRKPSDASPVVCSGRVWLGCSDGRLLAIDEQTGEEKWVVEHQGKFKASVAIADGKLFIANDRGSVFCYGESR